mmetsp:Transcript_29378/g.63374  ORF Transcript_29378/g.63374 Transcript_29378/m.63374 type:complete len:225 (+) Transcript_29378:1352-2026(+)
MWAWANWLSSISLAHVGRGLRGWATTRWCALMSLTTSSNRPGDARDDATWLDDRQRLLYALPMITAEKSLSGKYQAKTMLIVVLFPGCTVTSPDALPLPATLFHTALSPSAFTCPEVRKVVRMSSGEPAWYDAATLSVLTTANVTSPIDGPDAAGRCTRVMPSLVVDHPAPLTPQLYPVRCAVRGTSSLKKHAALSRSYSHELQFCEPWHCCMHSSASLAWPTV